MGSAEEVADTEAVTRPPLVPPLHSESSFLSDHEGVKLHLSVHPVTVPSCNFWPCDVFLVFGDNRLKGKGSRDSMLARTLSHLTR